MITDEQLAEGCRKSDRNAQRLLYEKYSRRMYGACLRYCSNTEEAEEILQEGFLKVFQHIGGFKGEGSLESWIKKIMINCALDHYRRNKNKLAETEWQENVTLSVEPLMDLKAKELLTIIQQLPVGFRTVFNLYAIEGYTHAEIGKMLNINEGTSKSQYARARTHLVKMIEKENNVFTQREEPVKTAGLERKSGGLKVSAL